MRLFELGTRVLYASVCLTWNVTAILNAMPHKLAAFIAFILLGSQVGLLSLIFIEYHFRSAEQYYASPPSNDNFKISALDRPTVSSKAMASWATLAATATYTLDFVNAEEDLEKLRDYFTTTGYDYYKAALEQTQFVQNIVNKKLVVSAVSVAPAMIIQEGEDLNGKYTWQVVVPILVSYLSASSNVKEFRVVSLTIIQVPTRDAPKGIGISRYVTNTISQNDIAG